MQIVMFSSVLGRAHDVSHFMARRIASKPAKILFQISNKSGLQALGPQGDLYLAHSRQAQSLYELQRNFHVSFDRKALFIAKSCLMPRPPTSFDWQRLTHAKV